VKHPVRVARPPFCIEYIQAFRVLRQF